MLHTMHVQLKVWFKLDIYPHTGSWIRLHSEHVLSGSFLKTDVHTYTQDVHGFIVLCEQDYVVLYAMFYAFCILQSHMIGKDVLPLF